MGNLIVGLILVAILAAAGYKIYWNKKHNVKCSGCSGGCNCSHSQE
ncbi:FeoB-associated Cys-rich membrane protein [Peptoniphilus sp. KCTC 25270]|nr:FeoB-associated Cys-rich membrane protein [Peptoniphilus sp. KCTC 25270]MCD1147322.1 FeoB-associated Cys-rich membrane protein [Peptoniphilus sp. KCTC 25270]